MLFFHYVSNSSMQRNKNAEQLYHTREYKFIHLLYVPNWMKWKTNSFHNNFPSHLITSLLCKHRKVTLLELNDGDAADAAAACCGVHHVSILIRLCYKFSSKNETHFDYSINFQPVFYHIESIFISFYFIWFYN